MKIGYACIALCVKGTKQLTCTQKYATVEKLNTVTETNLKALENIAVYNGKNNVGLFRISSHLIPFGSSPVNGTDWKNRFQDLFGVVAKKFREYNIRISTHPGQYSVLNSPNADVVKRAETDLLYHSELLSCLGGSFENKIILHIGGRYGDKKEALKRFKQNYAKLSSDLKKILVIENDDISFNIEDVLYLGESLNIPVVFDALHNINNPPTAFCGDNLYWIKRCKSLWKRADGVMKVHFSMQDKQNARIGRHSQSIDIMPFMSFFRETTESDVDIMLEVKNKNISAVKCINSVNNDYASFIKDFERYKLALMESCPKDYERLLSQIVCEGKEVAAYYNIIEDILSKKQKSGREYTALYIRDLLKEYGIIENQLKKYDTYLEKLKKGNLSYTAFKNFIYSVAEKADISELCESYYFL